MKDGGLLCGTTGNGDTPEQAIQDYARRISETLLVIDAYRDTRREIRVPRLVEHPPVAEPGGRSK